MKHLFILFGFSLIFVANALATQKPVYTAACEVWSEKWRHAFYTPAMQGKNSDYIIVHLDPKVALALFQDYPGESEKPYLKGSESNSEKIRMRYQQPTCPVIEFFDIGKALNQAKLTHEQSLAFRHALFEIMRHEARVQASRIAFAIENSVVATAIEAGKIHVNEAEVFEFTNLNDKWQSSQSEFRYEFNTLCSYGHFCFPWTAEKTVKFHEREDDELERIRSEYNVWLEHVEGNNPS